MAGITTIHSQVLAAMPQWERCRTVVAGSDDVKSKGTKYLPALSEQSRDEYDSYKMRTMFYNATGRTLSGLIGAIMRKDPSITVPSILAALVHDCTLSGVPLPSFAKLAVAEVLLCGRFGILVEMADQATDPARPYLVGYGAEQIVNWQTEMLNGVFTLVRVVLCEHVSEKDPTDPYVLNTIEQYRELYLEDGQYRQQVWRKQKDVTRGTDNWVRYEDAITPVIKGTPFPFIPFCVVSPMGLTLEVEKPPLLDLVDVNLSHYRSSADLEHGRHFCGLPTPCVTGISDKTTKLQIGSSIAWMLPDPQSKAYMLEFSGQGLGALETALEHKEKLMAVLGAKLLEEQKRASEAAESLQMRHSGEQSVLRSVALTVSQGLSLCLEWAALWVGVKLEAAKKASCQLNMDFIDNTMSFAELTELTKAWQSGVISYDTLYYNMQRGEVTRPGVNADKEKAEIEIEKPAQLPQNINPLTGLQDPSMNAE